jgi:hypothetical protein
LIYVKTSSGEIWTSIPLTNKIVVSVLYRRQFQNCCDVQGFVHQVRIHLSVHSKSKSICRLPSVVCPPNSLC